MKRAPLVLAGLCLTAVVAIAADSKADSAVATFKSVEGDAAKMKIFCEMSVVMNKAGDKLDAAAEAQVDGLLKQLGPEFDTAWNAGDDLDKSSPDAKKIDAAIDELFNKCPG